MPTRRLYVGDALVVSMLSGFCLGVHVRRTCDAAADLEATNLSSKLVAIIYISLREELLGIRLPMIHAME